MYNYNTDYFQQKLLAWHRTHNKRQLPWKGEKDVYRIWLSEIILQQTRAGQGWKYYESFVASYPTISHLAAAPLEEVYKLWEGLGYYSRCRNLHHTAQQIMTQYKGRFPSTYETILSLKGVGPYTAAAIASFGYNLPYAVVDGNVFRVLSRFFGIDTPIDSSAGKKLFAHLAQECLSKNEPAIYNQAIMDFGATLCKPEQPLCAACPLRRKCAAFATGQVQQLPVKEKRVKQRSRWLLYFVILHRGHIAVEMRTAKDIWQHLYQFPVVEFTERSALEQLDWSALALPYKAQHIQTIATTKPLTQKLTHQTIHARAVLLKTKGKLQHPSSWEWRLPQEVTELAFPRIIHQLLKQDILELFNRIT